MKRLKHLIIYLLLGLNLLNQSVFAADENLINNGSFEESSEDWLQHVWNSEAGITEFGIDSSMAHSGKRSVWIINHMPNDARFKQNIGVEGSTYYRLSCYVKTEDVPSDSKGANISVDEITDTSINITGTTEDWQYIELYGITDKDQNEIIVTVGLGGYGYTNSGKAWFDDVEVEKINVLPEGIEAINLFQEVNAKETSANTRWLTYLFLFLGGILLLPILFFKDGKDSVIKILKKTSVNNNDVYLNIHESNEPLRLSKKDYLLIVGMTFVYLIIALINLGSTNVPETGWTPHYSGESFVIAFSEPVNLSRISFFSALGNDRESKGIYQVEYLDKNDQYHKIEPINKEEIFKWQYIDIGSITTEQLKITIEDSGGTINEMGFFQEETLVKDIRIVEKTADIGVVENLFDEQETVAYLPSYLNSTYFDEIYFPRTAFEHLHGITPYENTHPPLGKLFIAFGISLFGMNPFGWRIIGTLFGVAMIPLMYLFGKKLFGKTFYAFCAALLMMFDFMHFTQTRLATIDSYSTFFILLMYYFMYDYFVNKSYQMPFKQSLKPLLFCGIAFGFGIASKWIALYGGAGLALLFFWSRISETRDYYKEKGSNKAKKESWIETFMPLNIKATVLACVLFFVVIPSIIYCFSYIPILKLPRTDNWITEIINYQKHMFDYHSTLQATHPFSSEWWEWPINKRPVWYYNGEGFGENIKSTIAAFGNPAIWWVGLLGIFLSLDIALTKKDKKMAVIFVAIAFQYLPWVLVPRITWIYHYFSTTPFMMLAIVYVIKNLIEAFPKTRYWIYGYLGVVVILFIMFYPVLSGFEVSTDYIESLKWFESWVF